MPPTNYNLTLAQVPGVTSFDPTSVPLLSIIFGNSQAYQTKSKTFSPFQIDGVQENLCWNALLHDLQAMYGACGRGILSGLGMSAEATGTTITVGKGHASCDGIVELSGDTPWPVYDDTTSFMWLLRNGQLLDLPDTNPPPTSGTYLGAVITAGGNVVSFDLSGVVFCKSGSLSRRSADAGAPTDVPPSNVMVFTRTQGGLYLWDGSTHNLFQTPAVLANVPQVQKLTTSYVPLGAAATSNAITLLTAPPKTMILDVIVKHTAEFGGGGINTYGVSLGTLSEPELFTTTFDVFQPTGDGVFQQSGEVSFPPGPLSFVDPTDIKIRATSTGANLDQATSGALEIYLNMLRLP